MQGQESETYDVRQAAALIGVHPQSLYAWIRSGECPFPVIRIGKKRVVIPKASIDRALSGEGAA
jgi:excisionase family DNA binding protein